MPATPERTLPTAQEDAMPAVPERTRRATVGSALPTSADRALPDPVKDDGWAKHGWILSAIWLIFLGYTIVAVLQAGRGPALTALGLVLVVLYAGVYVAGFILDGRLGGRGRRAERNWAGLALMVGIVVAMAAVVGMDALYMTPFLIAYSCYLLPRAGAWGVGIGCIALTLALPAWVGESGKYLFIVAIQLGIFVINMVTFALIERDNQNQRVRQDLVLVSERERVARDVHDVLGHTLTVVAVKAELAERLIDTDPDRSRAEITEIRTLVRGALADVRSTVGGLRGNDLPTQVEALRITLAGAGISVDVEGDPGADVAPALQVPLGWLLREAGTNVLRHARATRCLIRFEPGRLVIEDDGVGLGSSAAGHGMCGMNERMREAGAVLSVGAAGLGGTRVEASW